MLAPRSRVANLRLPGFLDRQLRQAVAAWACRTGWLTDGKADRRGLSEALARLRSGDTPIASRLDRLGRSMSHLIDTVRDLDRRGIGLGSLSEGIDMTAGGGTLAFPLFGALARFERDLIRERTALAQAPLLRVDEEAAERLSSPLEIRHGRTC